ncbi:YihY/virulence factor BrkB family protein (plasmid) [Lichenicola cladoniae]|uniref:YihY/virulence factor BrkB family protein n=1 Tax=Lichenicola cladoniae TaxID=1484109 RepID=A0A6M8HY25_9PROT|nr:YihY/virulence factor BrkB family protein [Lichenicola cladoniae]NPD70308.1 YihY/virulence factor BrkB family protein [Acetobacteraceae bacterium]QKE93240.1 YihY/virulence factor BrkB family protein [Lichenicola cladoniae]
MRSKLEHPALITALGITGLLVGALTRWTDTTPASAPVTPRRVAGRCARPARPAARSGWAIAKAVVSQVFSDRLMTEAAGVTFYTLLAIFPALAALISIYGLVADPRTIAGQLSALQGIMPGGGMDILKEQVESLISNGGKGLGVGLMFGVVTSLWSANQGTKALFEALNVINAETESRGFVHRTLVTLAFTLGALAFIVLAMGAVVVVPIVLKFLGLTGIGAAVLQYARWPLLLAVVGVLLALVYRFGPSREPATWRLISCGSGFAAVSWLAGSAVFSWYVANFGSYNKTYGSLGAVVGFMTWIWISVIIILVGGELNAELEDRLDPDADGAGP